MNRKFRKCFAVVLLIGTVIMGTASSAFACNYDLSRHFSGWSESGSTQLPTGSLLLKKCAVASSGCYDYSNWLKAEVQWSVNNGSTSTGWVQRSKGFTLRSNWVTASYGKPMGKAIARYRK